MTVGGGAYKQLHHHVDTEVKLNGRVKLICQCRFTKLGFVAKLAFHLIKLQKAGEGLRTRLLKSPPTSSITCSMEVRWADNRDMKVN